MIERDGRVLAAQRSAVGAQPLLWEFPGGKIEPGESEEAALRREIQEELGITITAETALAAAVHPYPAGTIRLHPWICLLTEGEPIPHEHAAIRWCRPDELRALHWAPADLPVLEDYLKTQASGDNPGG